MEDEYKEKMHLAQLNLEGALLLIKATGTIIEHAKRIAELEAENKRQQEFIQIILRANWKGYKDPVAEIQMLARRALP